MVLLATGSNQQNLCEMLPAEMHSPVKHWQECHAELELGTSLKGLFQQSSLLKSTPVHSPLN